MGGLGKEETQELNGEHQRQEKKTRLKHQALWREFWKSVVLKSVQATMVIKFSNKKPSKLSLTHQQFFLGAI